MIFYSIGRNLGVHLDLGMGVDGNLIAGLSLSLALDPGLDIGIGVGMHSDVIVNVFSS